MVHTYQRQPEIDLNTLFFSLSLVIKSIQNPNHNHIAPEALAALYLYAHPEQWKTDTARFRKANHRAGQSKSSGLFLPSCPKSWPLPPAAAVPGDRQGSDEGALPSSPERTL